MLQLDIKNNTNPAISATVNVDKVKSWILSTEVVAVFALVFAFVIRVIGAFHAPPLWIDETFTGALAAQPSFRDILNLARFDSPPVSYYLFMHVWQMAFGISDAALRAPSFIISVVTPLIIIFTKISGLSRSERLTWAALIALWIPGIGFAVDARFYAALLMFSTIQTIAFQKLMSETSLARACIWVSSATFSMLSHYDAAYLVLAQGLVFILVKRAEAFKTWPAIIFITPVIAEIIWKWKVLSHFAQIGTAWYPMLEPFDLITASLYILGGFGLGAVTWLLFTPLWLAIIFLLGRFSPRLTGDVQATAMWWAVLSALVGCVLMIAVGFIRPTFTWRYLTPFEPGLVVGILMIFRILAGQSRYVAYIGLMGIALISCKFWIQSGSDQSDSIVKSLSIAKASSSLIEAGASSVVFAWDSPNTQNVEPRLLSAVGGFFFNRAHDPVKIIVVALKSGTDPNAELLKLAIPGNSSIIWLYDLSIRNTTAKRYPPDINLLDHNYSCKNFGEGLIGSLACHPD
jgi:hypothetical protein